MPLNWGMVLIPGLTAHLALKAVASNDLESLWRFFLIACLKRGNDNNLRCLSPTSFLCPTAWTYLPTRGFVGTSTRDEFSIKDIVASQWILHFHSVCLLSWGSGSVLYVPWPLSGPAMCVAEQHNWVDSTGSCLTSSSLTESPASSVL